MSQKSDGAPSPNRVRASEAMYSTKDVARLTGLRPARLRRWHRSGLLRARVRNKAGLWYAFPDVVAARTAKGLIDKGVKPKRVREAVEAIRAWRPEMGQPLAALRVFSEAGRLVVRLEEQLVEPTSGQLVFDLPVSPIREAAGEVVRVAPKGHKALPRTAADWIDAGCDAESAGDPDTAEAAYRRALALEPTHVGALLNLGNLVYARGKIRPASELYRAATRSDPTYAPAWYNLANTLDDLDHPDAASRAYLTALELDPEYADAHFNLALLYEKGGLRARARPHWSAYLRLAPDGPSSGLARQFLETPVET